MRRIIALLAVAAVTSLGAASTSQAAAPVHEWFTEHDPLVWSDCGFTVREQLTGSLHLIWWLSESGVPERRLVAAPGARVTWTNVATGESVSSPNPFVVHRTYNPDGSSIIAFTGLVFMIPGQGRIYVDSGRDVIFFASGNIELLSTSGPSADLCEALTAAIG